MTTSVCCNDASASPDLTSHTNKPPWLILSDLHLGHPRRSPGDVRRLEPLLENIGHLIINGDSAELHHKSHKQDAQRGLDDLRKLCDQSGVTLDFIAGNHDPFLTDKKYIQLFEKQLLITHGDTFHDAIAPWCPSARILEQFTHHIRREVTGSRTLTLNLRMQESLLACQKLIEQRRYQIKRVTMLHLAMNPITTARVLWYWGQYSALSDRFLNSFAPQTKVLVYGHTHKASLVKRGGRILINTGSFGFPFKAQAVRINDRTLSVHAIKRTKNRYHLESKCLLQHEFSTAHHAAGSDH